MRALKWLLEGIAVALFAAGVFAVPWLWVKLFPPPGPYTAAMRHRIDLKRDQPERLKAGGQPVAVMRSRPPTPVEKLIFIDLRSRPQELIAYDGVREVTRFRVSGSRPGLNDAGPSRIRAKAERHWYGPEEEWREWWMTLEPLTAEGRARMKEDGFNGIHSTETSEGGSLGSPTTLGCIHMREEDARWLWEWTPVGTPVYVYKHRRQNSGLPALLKQGRELAGE